jgi:hypothetical protein
VNQWLKEMQKTFNILFSLFILFISVYHYDYWTNGNTVSRAVFVKAVVDDGSLNVDKYHEQSIDIAYVNGHYYSDKAPLPAIMAMPFYFFVQKIGFTKGNHLIYTIGNFIAGSLPFVLIILLTFFFMQQKDPKPENIFLCSIPFLGSFVFIYSGTFFAHALTSFFVLAAYILIRKKENYFLAGLLAGMAVLCEYPVFIIAALWALQILINKKKLKPVLLFISGGIPFGIFLLVYNYTITGSAMDFLYSHQQNFPAGSENLGFSPLPRGEAVTHLLFGIYRGILFFAPSLIALLFIFFRVKNLRGAVMLRDYFSLPCFIYFLAICTNVAWYGGWCYGPRYLSAIAVLLLFEGSIRMNKESPGKKILFYFFTSIGLLFTWLAKSTVVYSLPTEEKNPVFNIIIPEFFKGNLNENNLPGILFSFNPAAGNFLWFPFLFSGLYLFYYLQKKQGLLKKQG